MDADQLLFYLRGAFENCPKPNKAAWENIRAMIFMAHPVSLNRDFDRMAENMRTKKPPVTGCGCSGISTEVPAPVLQPDKL